MHKYKGLILMLWIILNVCCWAYIFGRVTDGADSHWSIVFLVKTLEIGLFGALLVSSASNYDDNE